MTAQSASERLRAAFEVWAGWPLRRHLLATDALPAKPLIASVPISVSTDAGDQYEGMSSHQPVYWPYPIPPAESEDLYYRQLDSAHHADAHITEPA